MVILNTQKLFIWSDWKNCVTTLKPNFSRTISRYARTIFLNNFLLALITHSITATTVLISTTCYVNCHKQLISKEKIPSPDKTDILIHSLYQCCTYFLSLWILSMLLFIVFLQCIILVDLREWEKSSAYEKKLIGNTMVIKRSRSRQFGQLYSQVATKNLSKHSCLCFIFLLTTFYFLLHVLFPFYYMF